MATFINHYSFVLISAVLVLGLAIFLFRDGVQQNDLLAIAALIIGFGFAFFTFNAGQSDIASLDQFDSALKAETPLLLEIQSPYCLACATAKPIVDRLEADQPELQVIRVNIQEPVGAALADRYQTHVTPTFLLIDAEGEIVLRTIGALDPQAVTAELE